MIGIRQARWGLKQLTIYRNLLDDEIIKNFIVILDLLDREETFPEKLTEAYSSFSALLLEKSELSSFPLIGDPWQNYLLERVLESENVFTLKSEKVTLEEMGISLLNAIKRDLTFLQMSFALDATRLQTAIIKKIDSQNQVDIIFPLGCLDWDDLKPLAKGSYPQSYHLEIAKQKELMYEAEDWKNCLENLAAYYMRIGSGLLGRYWAFYWDQGLHGIADPDPIKLENLVGYQDQRDTVIRNTKQFLVSGRANNMLLYGDRGTGKSSTIKALIHCYGHLGLRILEVPKQQMREFPEIIRELKKRPQRFIIFIDDLSFEEDEAEYKYLKAILEGGLEAQPNNVLVYATSNRRHLIKESFQDRGKPSEDLHLEDTVQEKLSLADRFGITVTFTAPNAKEYLSIVEGLARQEGLNISQDELFRLASKWELWQNGRSGRTAKQFIEDLLGKFKNNIT